MFEGTPSDKSNHPGEVDILLDSEEGVDTVPASLEDRGYGATVPEELRKDRLDMTLETQRRREVRFQNDCLQQIQIYRELEAAAQEAELPDFSRISAEIPEILEKKINELSQVLKGLDLYATVDVESIRKELGNMLRRHSYAERIAEVNTYIADSKRRIKEAEAAEAARLKADVMAEAEQSAAKARVALADALEIMDKEVKKTPMPRVGEIQSEAASDAVSSGGLFAGIKRLLGKK